MFNDNGKRVSCRVNRIVANTYIPNPDNHPVVRYKNNIFTDNRAENLEWGNLGDKPETKKNIRKCPVVQMDLNGNKVSEYESIAEAGRKTDIDPRYIIRCCKKDIIKTHGFMWRYKEEENWEPTVRKSCKSIQKIDPRTGNVIKIYSSMKDAIKENNISSHKILRDAISRREVCNGYNWENYIPPPIIDDLYEETRKWKLLEGTKLRISRDGRIYTDLYKRIKKS